MIVGSRCDSLPQLGFVDDYATRLHDVLADAGWRDEQAGLLLNPQIDQLKAAVNSAFAHANAIGATLLMSFIGHGVARGAGNFYLLATDSSAEMPNSDNSFHLPQFINERLTDYPSLDGVVLLIDACQATEGVTGAAVRWTDVLSANQGRMELLVASGADAAYDGCFTKTMLATFATGRDIAGANLMCADVRPAISEHCLLSQTQHLAYSGGSVGSSDPGLWLVPNIVRSADAVTGRPAAGLVDQLMTGLLVTDSLRENASRVEEAGHSRLRLVVGAAGAGKSTLLSLFIRPQKARAIGIDLGVADDYIKAAVFLDSSATLESVCTELAGQLTSTVPGFAEATASVKTELNDDDRKELDTWTLSVRMPLSRCRSIGRLRIIVDGLDQPEPGAREVIVEALHQLTHATAVSELGHVRVIAGVRSGTGIDTCAELAHAHRIEITSPSTAEVAEAATTRLGVAFSQTDLAKLGDDDGAGGWVLARLLHEVGDRADVTTLRSLGSVVAFRVGWAIGADETGEVGRVLSILGASGVGPQLPAALLGAALGGPAEVMPPARVHDAVVQLGSLITRSNAGTERETLGIAHQSILDAITGTPEADELWVHAWYGSTAAHEDLVGAYEHHFSDDPAAPRDVVEYWMNAAPRHYLGCGLSRDALRFLRSTETERRRDNRDRWASWVPAFISILGPAHADTVEARIELANWRGSADDPRAAAADYEQILHDLRQAKDFPSSVEFRIRVTLADWRGSSGDTAAAVAILTALLADQSHALGPDHPDILRTRERIATWRARGGDQTGAIAELEQLVALERRILGNSHRETLNARQSLAHQRGMAGDIDGCIADYETLIDDNRATADGATWLFGSLATEALAHWRIRAGNPEIAIGELQEVLQELDRSGNDEHVRAALSLRMQIAHAKGSAGDVPAAISELTALIDDQRRALGPDDRDEFTTRQRLAHWKAEAGDTAGGVAELEALLRDRLAALGEDHDHVFYTRRQLAMLRERDGALETAIAELEALLTDELRVRGPDTPVCLNTRLLLANWRGLAGKPSIAAADLAALIADMERLLPEDHADIRHARERLAHWTEIGKRQPRLE